jgi:hypothetical protein
MTRKRGNTSRAATKPVASKQVKRKTASNMVAGEQKKAKHLPKDDDVDSLASTLSTTSSWAISKEKPADELGKHTHLNYNK